MNRSHRLRCRAGVTLAELIVVLVLMGVIASFAAPPMMRWIRTVSSRSAADQIAADLTLARIQAVRQGRTVSFRVLNASTYQVTLDDAAGNVVQTIKQVDVTGDYPNTYLSPAAGRMAFDSRGLRRAAVSTVSTIQVRRGDRVRQIQVTDVGRIIRGSY